MTRQPARIGAVCRADTGGLAVQTQDFYRWMHPAKTMVVDVDHITGYHSDFSKFPDAQIAKGFEISEEDIDEFLKDIDVVFTVECPYNHALYSMARERGIKTVCQYNFEWFAQHSEPHLPVPDLLLAPSTWHMAEMEKWGVVKYMHVPVDRERFPFSLHTEAKKFLHIAGHNPFGDRNGTGLLLDCLQYLTMDIEIVIRTQDDLPRPNTDHRVTIIRDDVADNKDLFNSEDVLILPRRYGGLSLQLNEALSLGMPAIMLDIPPQNEFLPESWLVPAHLKEQLRIKTMIDSYECKLKLLALQIDWMAGRNLAKMSKEADRLARQRDWKVMAPKYRKLFNELNDNYS